MARVKHIQTNFAGGEISPNAYGRSDLQLYGASLQQASNVIVLPQGSARRRNGAQFVAQSPTQNPDISHELIPFRYRGRYMVMVYAAGLRIYNADGTYTGQSFATPWSASELNRLQWAQYQSQLIIVHPDHAPQELELNADDTWSFGSLSFQNIPQHSFPDFDYTPEVGDFHEFTFGGTWVNGETFSLVAGGTITNDIVYSSNPDVLIQRMDQKITEVLIEPELGLFGGVNINYAGAGVFELTMTSQFILFQSLEINEENSASGTLTKTASQGTAPDSISGSILEDAFSDTRGWPGSVAFYNQRLYFGGTEQLPQTLFGSVLGSYFDFRVGPEPDDAIQVKIAASAMEISWLAGLQFLHIGSTRGDYVMDDSSAPLPTFRRHTAIRSAALQPEIVDSEILAIDDCRCRLSRMLYSEERQSWLSNDLFLTADHISANKIRRVTHAQFRHPAVICLLDDGDAAIGSYRTDGAAWATLSIGKAIKAIATLEDPSAGEEWLWVVADNGVDDQQLLRIPLHTNVGHGAYLDFSVVYSGSPTTTITGLSHLEGDTVSVLADGAVLADQTVSGGQITLADAAADVVVGRRYTSTIKTMPLAYLFPGSSVDTPRRVSRVAVALNESGAPLVNEQELRELPHSAGLEDGPPALLTGRFQIMGEAYGEEGVIELTMDAPLPLTLQSVMANAVAHGG